MAVEPGDDDFRSTLDEASRKKAKNELHELNDKDTVLAVQTLRQWVLQQDWLKTPTDFKFLLKFIRVRKFSQLDARKTLENYWTIKTKVPEWFRDVDPADKTIQEILRTGFDYVPMRMDEDGRHVLIQTSGLLNLDKIKTKWGVDAIFKAMGMMCDWMCCDENIQVNGLQVLLDQTNATLGHMMTLWNQENGKKMVQFYQHSLPCRMKAMHFYKETTLFDAAFALMGPLLNKKSKERMYLHGDSMAKVYKHIDPCVLTTDYLPDNHDGPSGGTKEEAIEAMIADMMKPEFRDYIKDLSSSKYGVDLKKRAQDDAPVESFRKLNVE